jgi:alkyl sulfatase BDS1-like metallo-beta-lactamase superfamily hydrolase
MWGNARIVDYLKKQRDLYKYVHDQSVRLMNQGYVGQEIAETLVFPPELDRYWPNRGYYGTLRHNSRAVYQRYMGWYDGNPSNLNELPPEPAAKKYLEYMGGEAAVLERARADFARGEYRWVATALKHVVFANPGSVEGKNLLADAYEQLAYQAESGPWRSVYLQGAFELRNGVPRGGAVATASPDIIAAMPPEMMFDYMAVRLNGPKAAGRKLTLNIDFTDLGKQYALTVENGVLNYSAALDPRADATLTIAKQQLDRIQLRQATMPEAIASGQARLDGRREAFGEFMALLDEFPFWFNIVTP